MIYEGQRALITGASGGIGSALADELIQHGCDVVLTYRTNRERLRPLEELAAARNQRCVVYALDVRDHAQVRDVCQQACESLGVPTIVLTCAGLVRDRPLAHMVLEDWQDVIDTNLSGTFHVLREVAPRMMRSGGGRIVTLASVSGLHGETGQANYAASKGGVIAMTRALARELGPFNVTVNAIAPGIVETEMTATLAAGARRRYLERSPLRRFATPRDIVAAARPLLAPDIGCVTGQVIVVDGGLTC